jgi:hypothetical protein
MAKMWTSNEEFDFETARDHASKLVLLGSAHRAGIFEALLEEKDIHGKWKHIYRNAVQGMAH